MNSSAFVRPIWTISRPTGAAITLRFRYPPQDIPDYPTKEQPMSVRSTDLRVLLMAAAAACGSFLGCSSAPEAHPVRTVRPAEDVVTLEGPAESPAEKGSKRIEVGAGVMTDPDAFLLSMQADFFLFETVAVGPMVQIGLSDDEVVIAPTANVKKSFVLSGDEDLVRLHPYAQAGLGFAYLYEEDRRGDDDDLGVLLNAGIGADYDLSDHTQLGTGVMFHYLPGEVLDEHSFFTWKVLSLGFRF
jgi:hypothetical protein